MSCGNQTLAINRPSQSQFNDSCGSTTKSSAASCGSSDSCKYVSDHSRTLGPRKHREKVREDIKDYVLLMLGAPVVKVELDAQQLDLAVVPPLDHVGAVVQRPQVRVAGLQLRQFLDEIVDDDRIVLLVSLKDFVQHVETVRREPVRILVGFENACFVRGF